MTRCADIADPSRESLNIPLWGLDWPVSRFTVTMEAGMRRHNSSSSPTDESSLYGGLVPVWGK